jgi:hypothetical protein
MKSYIIYKFTACKTAPSIFGTVCTLMNTKLFFRLEIILKYPKDLS